jgi:hypothetical protein
VVSEWLLPPALEAKAQAETDLPVTGCAGDHHEIGVFNVVHRGRDEKRGLPFRGGPALLKSDYRFDQKLSLNPNRIWRSPEALVICMTPLDVRLVPTPGPPPSSGCQCASFSRMPSKPNGLDARP